MADVTDEDFQELGIPLGHEDGERMGDKPIKNTNHPELKAQSESSRQCAIDNGNTPWRPAQQDGFGQRPAHRDGKALDMITRYH